SIRRNVGTVRFCSIHSIVRKEYRSGLNISGRMEVRYLSARSGIMLIVALLRSVPPVNINRITFFRFPYGTGSIVRVLSPTVKSSESPALSSLILRDLLVFRVVDDAEVGLRLANAELHPDGLGVVLAGFGDRRVGRDV